MLHKTRPFGHITYVIQKFYSDKFVGCNSIVGRDTNVLKQYIYMIFCRGHFVPRELDIKKGGRFTMVAVSCKAY